MQDHHLLLSLIAALSYGLESVFGFGGTVYFLGLSGMFFDFKDMLYMAMLVSCVASATILLQVWRHFDRKHFVRIMLVTTPFVILGTALIDLLKSVWLLKIFAFMLVAYGVFSLLKPNYAPPRSIKYAFVALGGLVQGIFTTGGPFIMMGYRQSFDNKTQLKATMAGFFLISNLWRMFQTMWQRHDGLDVVTSNAWAILPVIVGVTIGHFIHSRLPEKTFQRYLLLSITGIGFLLLLK